MSALRAPRLASLLVVLLAATPLARAQSWMAVGLPGGDVRALAADPRDPRVVYLGTADGILYRSGDGGASWRRTQPGFPLRGMSLDQIVVDAAGAVLVGYWEVTGPGGGVARSRDEGRTFTILPEIGGQSVRALAVAASDPRVLVAGTLTGVFRSGDGGSSWQRISTAGDPEIRNINSLAVDPGDPQVIYAGTWHLAWKTTDGGGGWKPIHLGMINDSDVMTLTFDHRSPRTVYATACSGIYRSPDAGGHWAKVPGIPASARRTRSFAQDSARPDVVYAGTTEGLWASEDGMATWRLLTPRELVVNAVLVLPGGALLLGADGAGVLRSPDGGATWASSNDGFFARFVSRVIFDPAQGRILAGVLDDRQAGGVLSALKPSGPWSKVGGGLEGRQVLSMALAGSEVLAGTDDGLYFSMSQSGLWRPLPAAVDGIDLHPSVTDVVALSDRTFLAATSQGLLRSVDGGEHWERHRLGLGLAVLAVAASLPRPTVVLAATPLGFFRSLDGGASWTQISPSVGEANVHGLAFLPGNDRVVFATTPRGLLRSPDQGQTWLRRGGGLPLLDITGLALHPDGRTAYASDFTRGGIYRSEDGGESWQPFSTEGLLSDRVWALAVDPASPDRLLAAARSGGLHEWRALEAATAAGSR
jgi:photosystem II stability/assembly factor-like uncharacterized protein